MPIYEYSCKECGWKGLRINVPIDKRDEQFCIDCPNNQPKSWLDRSTDLSNNSFQIDASGNIGCAVSKDGNILKGQFGGDHSPKRRWKQ